MDSLFTRRALVAGAAAITTGCFRRSKPGFSGYAFVANEEGKAVAVVDLTAFAVVRHIALNGAPTQMVSNSARQRVYALTPSTGTVHEISRTKLLRERWTAMGGVAMDMRLGERGNSLWVLMKEPRELVEVRLDTMDVGRRIALPHAPVDLDISIREPRALVSFGAEGLAGVVDLRTGGLQLARCGSPIGKARFREDGRQWVAAHTDRNLLTMVDTASGRVIVRLPLAMRPEHLCFKADGGQLFVTGGGSDAMAIVFPYSTEVAETVLAGRAPAAMAASPMSSDSPEFLFVTNPGSSQVTILNIETRKVVAVAQVGAEPSHVVITPDNQYALVLNQKSGDMAVILIQSTARRTKFPAALFTMIPVGSKPVSAVVQAV